MSSNATERGRTPAEPARLGIRRDEFWLWLPICGAALGDRSIGLPWLRLGDIALGLFLLATLPRLLAVGRPTWPAHTRALGLLLLAALLSGLPAWLTPGSGFVPIEFGKSLLKLIFYAVGSLGLSLWLQRTGIGPALRVTAWAFALAGLLGIGIYALTRAGVALPAELVCGSQRQTCSALYYERRWFGDNSAASLQQDVFLRAQGLASEPTRFGYLQAMALGVLLLHRPRAVRGGSAPRSRARFFSTGQEPLGPPAYARRQESPPRSGSGLGVSGGGSPPFGSGARMDFGRRVHSDHELPGAAPAWSLVLIALSALLSFALAPYALLLTLGLLLALRLWRDGATGLRRRVALGSAVLALVCLLPPLGPALERIVVQRVVRMASGQSDASAFLRVSGSWIMARALIDQRPLTGAGLGHFDLGVAALRARLPHSALLQGSVQGWNVLAHVLGTLGLVGLLAFLNLCRHALGPQPSLGLLFMASLFADGTFLGAALWVFLALCAHAEPLATAPRTSPSAVTG